MFSVQSYYLNTHSLLYYNDETSDISINSLFSVFDEIYYTCSILLNDVSFYQTTQPSVPVVNFRCYIVISYNVDKYEVKYTM